MKIAVTVSGNVDVTRGRRWSEARHDLVFGVREPESTKAANLLEHTHENAFARRPRLGRLFLALALVAFLADPALADVSLPAVFGDHMVLQRDRPVPVWGRGRPNEKVTVLFAGQRKRARTTTKGTWRVTLDPLKAGGPHTLVVKGENEVRCEDVLVGEVWVCSGQSNMQWSVRQSGNAREEIAAASHPRLRLLSVPRRPSPTPQGDFQGRWAPCTPKAVPSFSAVAYYFGRRLLGELDVPIGLIHTSYGGTPAEAWTDLDALEQERGLKRLLKRWEQALKRGRGGKRDPALSPHRPANLWNGMVAPLVGYGIRGVIWYQGESNAGRAVQYQTLFPALIRAWRERWRQGPFPFLFVQLANFRPRRDQPGESAWAELREAQRLALALPSTGMAVAIDIGEAKNIHPKNKQDVGARLAAWALHHTYGRQAVVPSGPLFQGAQARRKDMVLAFDHAEGLGATDGAARIVGFTVAGRDQRWVHAEAVVEGNTVVVSHPEGKKVRYVRYAWADNPACNLVNGAGLPASPFRTDELPLTTKGKD